MITLYTGDDAGRLAEKAIGGFSGDIYRTDKDRRIPDILDEISTWISRSGADKCIVVDPATARDDTDLEAYRALRRIAKFNGVDVHLVGDASVEETADRTVASDDDLDLHAPGSTVGAEITDLMRSERMSDFERVEMDIPTWQEIMATSNCTEREAQDKVAWLKNQAVWANNLYQVNIEFMQGGRAHIMIRRLDRQAIHNWQHFQEIKNRFLGPECEAVEVYPRVSHLVDEKHHYHLWGFRSPEDTFGIGFRVGPKSG